MYVELTAPAIATLFRYHWKVIPPGPVAPTVSENDEPMATDWGTGCAVMASALATARPGLWLLNWYIGQSDPAELAPMLKA